jgi:hypothetical protein
VSDRIRLWISGDALVQQAADTHRVRIADEVLATSLVIGEPQQGDDTLARQSVDLDGIHAGLALTRDE